MKRIAVIIAVVASIVVATMGPAAAEKVHVDDPRGDDRRASYDITRLEVDHRPARVRIKLEQDGLPYVYLIRVDLPGRQGWDYMVTYDVYTPNNVTVETRRQFRSPALDSTCQSQTVRTNRDSSVLKLKFKRSCLGNPRSLRMRADANDDQFCSPCDSTRWTPWADRA